MIYRSLSSTRYPLSLEFFCYWRQHFKTIIARLQIININIFIMKNDLLYSFFTIAYANEIDDTR
jgi:hypothetical protein